VARKKPLHLTEAELRVMNVVWQKGRATVAEVAAALPKELDLAYNTVLTMLRILEAKGYSGTLNRRMPAHSFTVRWSAGSRPRATPYASFSSGFSETRRTHWY
jgi:predicted transcriptional regulator